MQCFFFSTFILGIYPAIFIALVPSFIALISGILPLVAFPFIPFIIISNMILVLTFYCLKSRYWLAVIFSSFLKFIFLFLISHLVLGFFVSEKITLLAGQIIIWPQLFTAISGGIVAYFVLKSFKKIQ